MIDSYLEPLAHLGFRRVSTHCFEKQYHRVSHSLIFQSSNWDDTFYVSAMAAVSESGDSTEVGGRVSLGAVDYFDYSFAIQKYCEWRKFEPIYKSVVCPWYEFFEDENSIRAEVELSDSEYEKVVSKRLVALRTLWPSFFASVEESGFVCAVRPGHYIFSRLANDLWHVLIVEIVGNGVFAAIRVGSWIPEFQLEGNVSKESKPFDFESINLLNGGFINGGSVSSSVEYPIVVVGSLRTADKKMQELREVSEIYFNTQCKRTDTIESIQEIYRRSSYFKGLI